MRGFRRGWGPEQAMAGPVLVVPYSWTGPPARVGGPPIENQGLARLPASALHVAVALRPETRRRGLFHAVVYTAAVEMTGAVTVPALDLKDAPGAVVDWGAAQVMLRASDWRGMAGDARMGWNDASVPLEPTNGGCDGGVLTARANLAGAPAAGTAIPFSASLTVRGTGAFRLVPLGRQIDMTMTSPWPTPSFDGGTLPAQYQVGADGFQARWELAGISGWQVRANTAGDCHVATDPAWFDADSHVGVELQEAVPTYLMVSRASKYGVLFLALTYLTLFLFEALSGVRIHLVQYGLVGLSVSLFALLLVSIAEPIGFTAAYALSTVAVMAQASLYTLSVVRRVRLAGIFAAVLGGLFGFLYVVLSLDSYALLAGTVALFAILSVIMVVTRRVNWSAVA